MLITEINIFNVHDLIHVEGSDDKLSMKWALAFSCDLHVSIVEKEFQKINLKFVLNVKISFLF